MNDQYHCLYCNKEYSNKKSCDKHALICMEMADCEMVPSNFSLFKRVQKLENMVSILVDENKRLKNIVFKKKKKIPIIDWLNKQGNEIDYIMYKNYGLFIKKILDKKLENNLQYLINNSYINAYFTIIKHLTEENIFIAWNKKRNLYYYNNSWKIFKLEDLSDLIRKIQRIIMGELKEKRDELSIDQQLDINNTILGGTTIERQIKNEKIYINIWRYLNKDIESHIEYNIVF